MAATSRPLPPHEWKDIRDVSAYDMIIDGFGNKWPIDQITNNKVSNLLRQYKVYMSKSYDGLIYEVSMGICATMTEAEKFMVCVEKKQ
jgi:hypothetical protein